MSRERIVFLDRDGAINEDTGYIRTPGEVVLLPGAAEAVRRLAERYVVVVVTNQSGVSRGFYGHDDIAAVHARLAELLAEAGARWDHIRYCPHQRADGCGCRKPEPGMLIEAAEAVGLSTDGSWMVGDRSTDIEAGRAVGARTILLPEPYDAPPLVAEPDLRADSLLDAAEIILREDQD